MNLGEKELQILQNSEFLPLKARVCGKIEGQLQALWDRYRLELQEWGRGLPAEVLISKGKLSKGENYRQQAYRVLDYPSVLTRDDMFLFRTMMLWGDAYSWHFILSGKYLDRFGSTLLTNVSQLPKGAHIGLHDNPWVWYRKDEGWKRLDQLDEKELKAEASQRKFLKISHFLDLGDYNKLETKGLELLRAYVEVLGREKR